MATPLTTDVFDIPTSDLGRIEERVKDQSILASLSPERPTLYGNVEAVRMSRKPRAQIVAEGAQKESDTAGWESVIASPIKVQTTIRMTDEVKWADSDHRLMIVDDLIEALSGSVARAVDLVGLHAINPITGSVANSVQDYLTQTDHRVVAGGAPTAEIEAAAGTILGARYVPTGVAFDTSYAFKLATERDSEGRKLHPDLGFGTQISSVSGLTAATSSTVSGQPEASDTGVRAIVGDFTQMRWGFQRRFPVEVIQYGDPDGNGDLKGNNQIAYRVEGVFYVAVFDKDGFVVIEEEIEGGSGD